MTQLYRRQPIEPEPKKKKRRISYMRAFWAFWALIVTALVAADSVKIRSEIKEEAHEDRVNEATVCVDRHRLFGQLENVLEQSVKAGGEVGASTALGAIIDYVAADPAREPLPPDIEERLGELAAARAERDLDRVLPPILADLDRPACDREAAERYLREQGKL